MRLFYQLSEKEQNNVIHHCADLVIDDMLDGALHFDPISEEDFEFQERLEDALKEIQKMNSVEEKVDYLMADEYIQKAVYDIALEMAKGAFYHDDEEIVIYPDSLEEDEEENKKLEDESLDLPEMNTVNKKSSHSVN